MSININCPKCQSNVSYEAYSTIEIENNPELKEKVLDDSIFDFICPDCKHQSKLYYPLIYKDKINKYEILLSPPDENLDSFLEILDKHQEDDKDLKIRIVHGPNDLKEKIFIFDNNLDDKVVETLKIFVIDSLNKNEPDKNVKKLYFSIEDGKYFVEAFSEDKYIGKIVVPKDKYALFNNIYHEHKNKDINDDYHVDFEWAYNLYVGKQNKNNLN